MADLVDKVFKHAKRDRLAVVAYDIHKLDQKDGTFICKVDAFCYHYVLPL